MTDVGPDDRRRALRGAALLAAGLLVFLMLSFGRACFGGWWIVDRSPASDTYMLGTIYERWAGQVKGGHLPLWFPEFGGGYPVHAAWMYGLFYPPLLLFCVLPPEAAWTWLAILHIVFGALGVYAFLWDERRDVAAAASAAVVFATSGFVLVRFQNGHLNLLMPYAWAPWTLVFAARTARAEAGAAVRLGLCAAFGLLAGHVQVWFYVAPLVAGYAVLEAVRNKTLRAAAPRLLGAAALTIAVTAIQWLPAAELFFVSGHPPDDPRHVEFSSATPLALAAQIAPRLIDVPQQFRHELLGLAGPLAVVAALLGFRPRDGRRWYWLLAAAFGLFLAVGTRSEASRIANDLPPFSFARTPGRALSIVVIAGSVLAGHAAADWLGRASTWLRAAAPAAFLASAIAFGAPPPDVVRSDFLDYDWSRVVPPGAAGRRVHVMNDRYPYVERWGLRTDREVCYFDMPGHRALKKTPTAQIAWWFDIGLQIGVRTPGGRFQDAAETAKAAEGATVMPMPSRGDATFFARARTGGAEGDVLERVRAGAAELWIDGDPTEVAPAKAPPPTIVRRPTSSPSELAYDVPAGCGGWLLLSENWYPGWVAFDEAGVARPARRGDLCFLAVPAARAGRLEYRPSWLVPALIVSLGGLALGIVIVVRTRRAP